MQEMGMMTSIRLFSVFHELSPQIKDGKCFSVITAMKNANMPLIVQNRVLLMHVFLSYDVNQEYAREIGNPYSMRFDEYNKVFNNEIEHLSNEYILRIGMKGYVLDDVWEKCQQIQEKPKKHAEEGYERLNYGRSGDEKDRTTIPY
ncbi:hypothetical protein Tco_1242646, partial [Tanacetum coccineum]